MIPMSFSISGLDLLLLTLSIIGYAAAATAWTYFAMPPVELHPAPGNPGTTEFFAEEAERDPKA